MDENEERDFRSIGKCLSGELRLPAKSAFRLIGCTLKPRSFATIGELRPGTPPSSIGTLLSATGCAERPRVGRVLEMVAIDHAMISLKRLRSAWRYTAPSSETELNSYRDDVHKLLMLLARALLVDDNHDVKLGHRIEAFRVHGYLADIDSAHEGLVVDDWLWCFIEYPLWATNFAMKEFIRVETKRPQPAAVREYLPVRELNRAADEVTGLANNERFWRAPLADLVAA